jgi:hypothetical protein
VIAMATSLNNPDNGPTKSNAIFTASSRTLKVACDDGFGWPENIPLPAWGDQRRVKPRGVAKAYVYQDGSEVGKFTDISDTMSFGAQLADAGWAHTAELGCWPVWEGIR